MGSGFGVGVGGCVFGGSAGHLADLELPAQRLIVAQDLHIDLAALLARVLGAPDLPLPVLDAILGPTRGEDVAAEERGAGVRPFALFNHLLEVAQGLFLVGWCC